MFAKHHLRSVLIYILTGSQWLMRMGRLTGVRVASTLAWQHLHPGTIGLNWSTHTAQLKQLLFLFFKRNPEGMRTSRLGNLGHGQHCLSHWGIAGCWVTTLPFCRSQSISQPLSCCFQLLNIFNSQLLIYKMEMFLLGMVARLKEASTVTGQQIPQGAHFSINRHSAGQPSRPTGHTSASLLQMPSVLHLQGSAISGVLEDLLWKWDKIAQKTAVPGKVDSRCWVYGDGSLGTGSDYGWHRLSFAFLALHVS